MLKTRKYREIWDGTRRFVGFDQLMIDPMATDKAAREVVDKSEVERLADEFARLELTEESFIRWQTAKYRLALAVQKYEKAVREYALANPIHMHPRGDEQIYCPLIEYAKTI